MRFLTIDDFDFKGKTVFLRVDMNCPIDPETLEISGTKRIEETVETINSLKDSKIVMASHQGRVGNKDYISMEKHAKVLEGLVNRKIKYVDDVIGTAAQNEIQELNDGEILLLDNLRLCAEENYEFANSDAEKTIMVKRLAKLFDACVLDSFPSAHRSHPSIVGFSNILIILGGKKVDDRFEAIRLLIENGRAENVLLTGLIASVFLRAQGRIKSSLGINREEEIVTKAHALIGEYPDVFSTPVDVAIEQNGKRVDLDVRELNKDDQIFDLGPKTIEHYNKIISGAGTVFFSGPAGFFEKEGYDYGTNALLEAVSNSMATTIVSGGHLTSALKKIGLAEKITHISTAGGALVRYLTGAKLPMIQSLEESAKKFRPKE